MIGVLWEVMCSFIDRCLPTKIPGVTSEMVPVLSNYMASRPSGTYEYMPSYTVLGSSCTYMPNYRPSHPSDTRIPSHGSHLSGTYMPNSIASYPIHTCQIPPRHIPFIVYMPDSIASYPIHICQTPSRHIPFIYARLHRVISHSNMP
jgi:hypothetical protein